MRPSLFLIVAPLLSLAECGPVTLPPSPDKFNACTSSDGGPSPACEAFCPRNSELCLPPAGVPTCALTSSGASACLQSSEALPPSFVLVVDVPRGSQYAPGQTFVLTKSMLAATQNASRVSGCATGNSPPCCGAGTLPVGIDGGTPYPTHCVPLPLLAKPTPPTETPDGSAYTEGAYLLNSGLSSSIHVDAGVPILALPVAFTLTPRWTIDGTGFAVPPALVGLPIPVIEGSIVSGGFNGDPGASWASFNFNGGLPAELTYSQAMTPLPPFQTVPPVVDQTSPDPWGNSTSTPLAIATTVCVDLPPGHTTDTAGWTVYFREQLEQRVVSSVAGLSPPGAGGCIGLGATVYSYFPDLPTETFTEPLPPVVVVSPPAGAVFPTIVEPFVGASESYSNLPPPVRVEGQVFQGTSTATPVAADLHFVSTSLYLKGPAGCVNQGSGGLTPTLFYDAAVSTRTDPGHVGEYSVTLPDGQYSVTVDAEASSGAPQTVAKLRMPFGPSDCPATRGLTVNFETGDPIGVTGIVELPGSGGPLPFATVDLTPSQPAVNPSPPPGVAVSPIDSPRSFEVTTDANGEFSLSGGPEASVGPGLYDITVRPLPGTNFPWVVSPAHLIAAIAGDAPDGGVGGHRFKITVPAPAPLTVTVHDPSDVPIADALVRAYAFPCLAGTSCFSAALQIGEAFTDATGSFQMLLAPNPFVTGN